MCWLCRLSQFQTCFQVQDRARGPRSAARGLHTAPVKLLRGSVGAKPGEVTFKQRPDQFGKPVGRLAGGSAALHTRCGGGRAVKEASSLRLWIAKFHTASLRGGQLLVRWLIASRASVSPEQLADPGHSLSELVAD